MKKSIIIITFSLLSILLFSETFILNDGTVINGEIISFSKGKYLIKTKMGELTINNDDIIEIKKEKSSPSENNNNKPSTNEAINEYNENKAWLSTKTILKSKDLSFVSTQYDVMQGEYTKSSLANLAKEMGEMDMATKFNISRFENGYLMAVSFIGVASLACITFGAAFTAISLDESSNFFDQERNQNMYVAGISLLAVGGTLAVPSIVFLVLYIYAKVNNFDVNQANNYIKKYNRWLKNKLGLPLDFDTSYNFNNERFDFKLSYKF